MLSPADHDPAVPAPCVYWIHGGGMVMGDRFGQIDIPLEWLERFGVVVVTVEYRLAPRPPAPPPSRTATGAGLGGRARRGAGRRPRPRRGLRHQRRRGLAAGLCLLARDRGTPAVAAQLLICPMLDHRNVTASSRQYSEEPGVWTRETNEFAWRTLLGGRADGEVPYVSPRGPPTCPGCPPPTWTPARPRCSATRTWPTPPPSGRRAARRTACGRAGTTVSTRSSAGGAVGDGQEDAQRVAGAGAAAGRAGGAPANGALATFSG
ncbi:alpha/beta hydrolase [Streptomyces thermocarboxydus]